MSRYLRAAVVLVALCTCSLTVAACAASHSGDGDGTGGSGDSSTQPAGSAPGVGNTGQASSAPAGAARKLPASCDVLTAVVQRDLAVTVASVRVGPTSTPPSSLDCEFHNDAYGANAEVDLSFELLPDANSEDAIWETVKGSLPGTKTELVGIGDGAFISEAFGRIGGLVVRDSLLVLTITVPGFDTDPPRAGWEQLAKDLVAN